MDNNITFESVKNYIETMPVDVKYYIIIACILLVVFVIMFIRNRKYYKLVKEYNLLMMERNELERQIVQKVKKL
ncbi:hypothetical protein [Campylobacter sp. JMF_08 NE1]|uniref:hypothetical protein n=1 Tax=Campylobacter sp. JMF_08 NE1 TaxID=2983821 RepID=UPI0022E9B708|nr:hypothetical protein [Campylobacter sp. JMF_08 NE1]MDA3048217.1 hypothetical protein [Campylobacter sp. JMF_08 NE1]